MERLRAAHADVGGDVVSAGGTGTYDLHGTTGVTEVQAGSYALMDTYYATLGLPFEQAAVRRRHGRSPSGPTHAVADVGLKALGMDHGNPSIDGATVWFCSDEHVTFAARRRPRPPSATASASCPPTSTRRWRCTRRPGSCAATRCSSAGPSTCAAGDDAAADRALALAGRGRVRGDRRRRPWITAAHGRIVTVAAVADAVGPVVRARRWPLAAARRRPPAPGRGGRTVRRRGRRGDGRAARASAEPSRPIAHGAPAAARSSTPTCSTSTATSPRSAPVLRPLGADVVTFSEYTPAHASEPAALRARRTLPVPHRAAGAAPAAARRCGADTRYVAADDPDEAPHRRRRRRRARAATVRVIVIHTQSPIAHHGQWLRRPRRNSPTLSVDGPARHDRRLQRRLVAPRVPGRCSGREWRDAHVTLGRGLSCSWPTDSWHTVSRGTRRSCASTTPSSTTGSSCSTSTTSTCRAAITAGSSSPSRERASSAVNARPRWDRACFSSSAISANVRPSPSSGTNTAS